MSEDLLSKCDVCGEPWGWHGSWCVSSSTNPKEYQGHVRCLFPERYKEEIQKDVDRMFPSLRKVE
jgi:hypothetical protein